jgi:hypothetical protein
MSNDLFNVSISTNIKAVEYRNGESKLLFEKANNIHPQNMTRILARALSHEANSYIYRLALGNGGTTTGADGSIIFKPANDGSDGSGWQSRLYNETYSEVVDGTSSLVGTDPGSADANNVRPGGGANPADDPAPDNVVSVEVGTKSNVIVTMYLNENEPSAELLDMTQPAEGAADLYFDFNELGLYSFGKQARDSSGYSSVNVGNKTSSSNSTLTPSTSYNITITVDGVPHTAVITTPSTGTGTAGALTYGDICEGINGGAWITSGDALYNFAYVYITDDSNGTYPTILAKQSYGYLNFQSLSSGLSSTVNLSCSTGIGTDFFNVLVLGICGNVNYIVVPGAIAGVQNDSVTPTNERERLLTHLIFAPIRKTQGSTIVITYTLTVSVNPTVSSITNELIGNPPT